MNRAPISVQENKFLNVFIRFPVFLQYKYNISMECSHINFSPQPLYTNLGLPDKI